MRSSVYLPSSNALIDLAGGAAGGTGAERGDDGRLLEVFNNIPSNNPTITAVGRALSTSGEGQPNPHYLDQSRVTRNLVGLIGGADIVGVLEEVSSSDAFFDDIRASAPEGAVAAIARLATGPDGIEYSFADSDVLLLINLTESSLPAPQLGMLFDGQADLPLTPLQQRGFANTPDFGGNGPQTLLSLPGNAVYGSLVSRFDSLTFRARTGGAASFAASAVLARGEVSYLEAISSIAGDFNSDGVVDAADYTVWRDGLGTTFTPNDYNVWANNFGTAAPTSSTSVPEPTAGLLLMLAAIAGQQRRRN